jgi:hypothetical protein
MAVWRDEEQKSQGRVVGWLCHNVLCVDSAAVVCQQGNMHVHQRIT